MKKLAFVVALACLLSCFAGCADDTPQMTTTAPPPISTVETTGEFVDPVPSTTADMADPTDPVVAPLSQISLSSAATPVITETFYAEDGALLLNYIYQNVYLIHQDFAVADAVFLALVNEMDYSTGLQEALQQAKEDYASNPTGWKAYEYQVLFDTMRLDQNVLSVFGEVTSTTTESSSIQVSSSYSLVDGKKLTFGDIQAKGYQYYPLLLKIVDKLQQTDAKDQLFEDYQQTLAGHLLSKNFANWFFTENGLSFFYLPYEIASNAAGTIVVEIPYSDLAGILDDKYFPAEDYVTGGSLFVQPFDQAQIFHFQSFAEVIQHTDGEEFLMYTDGALSDLRLELGAWDAAGTTFVPQATIFACDGISSESAIVVQCKLSDPAVVLRVSFISDQVLRSRYITWNSDGSITLTNA